MICKLYHINATQLYAGSILYAESHLTLNHTQHDEIVKISDLHIVTFLGMIRLALAIKYIWLFCNKYALFFHWIQIISTCNWPNHVSHPQRVTEMPII